METLETRLNEVARIAVRLEQQTGCSAQLLIAQWAIESEWGEKPVGQANYFDIKRATLHTKWCTVATREVINGKSVVENLKFADYASLADSCRDYARHAVRYALAVNYARREPEFDVAVTAPRGYFAVHRALTVVDAIHEIAKFKSSVHVFRG